MIAVDGGGGGGGDDVGEAETLSSDLGTFFVLDGMLHSIGCVSPDGPTTRMYQK